MISALWGILRDKQDGSAIIDCGGVGYGVEMPAASLLQLGELEARVQVFVHTHVAEDQLRLFAFATRQERDVFVVLLSTAGIGPKLALVMLSSLDVEGLWRAVQEKDRRALMQVPGVGGKKADRLLVDLQDRLPVPNQLSKPVAAPGPVKAVNKTHEEVEGALLHLGFAAQQAGPAARDAIEAAEDGTDVTSMIRQALRQLSHPKNARRETELP